MNMEETTFYVNHKPKKRLIENLGLGFLDRKVGSIPAHTSVWIQYFEDEGRKPYFVLTPRNGGSHVKDSRGYAYINDMNMESNEYLNNRMKLKRALKKKGL
jgi:hypothetical protein